MSEFPEAERHAKRLSREPISHNVLIALHKGAERLRRRAKNRPHLFEEDRENGGEGFRNLIVRESVAPIAHRFAADQTPLRTPKIDPH